MTEATQVTRSVNKTEFKSTPTGEYTYFLGPLALGFLAKSEGSRDSRDLPLVLNKRCALSSSVLQTQFKQNDTHTSIPQTSELDRKSLQTRPHSQT